MVDHQVISPAPAHSPAVEQRTPLFDFHVKHGARMVPFAGYSMPLRYDAGILGEHIHTRQAASLFDVSHMGQIRLYPRSGLLRDAALALETVVPVDVLGIAPGRQRYGLITNEAGGIIDDLMIANRGDHLLLVVNASCKTVDEAVLRAALSDVCAMVAQPERALLALQGPLAETALSSLAPRAGAMRFMDITDLDIDGVSCVVSRSGYTGEDGYEIGMAAIDAVNVAEALLAQDGVALAGLGARDSLRLEAGLCLHGSDIDDLTTPVEAALEWAVQKVRRPGGAREGGFAGADIILAQFRDGAERRRVGLLGAEGSRAALRHDTKLYDAEEATDPVGTVTSGCFGPSFGGPVALGYLPTSLATIGQPLFADLRGKRVPVTVSATPFVAANYKR